MRQQEKTLVIGGLDDRFNEGVEIVHVVIETLHQTELWLLWIDALRVSLATVIMNIYRVSLPTQVVDQLLVFDHSFGATAGDDDRAFLCCAAGRGESPVANHFALLPLKLSARAGRVERRDLGGKIFTQALFSRKAVGVSNFGQYFKLGCGCLADERKPTED